MTLKKGKHIIKEINGVLCTVVESGITSSRKDFLKSLLELNKYTVEIEEVVTETAEKSYTLGVTDVVFNPMINVYARALKRPGGEVVTIAYWNQETEEKDLPYFEYRERNPDMPSEDDFLSNPWAFRTIG